MVRILLVLSHGAHLRFIPFSEIRPIPDGVFRSAPVCARSGVGSAGLAGALWCVLAVSCVAQTVQAVGVVHAWVGQKRLYCNVFKT